MRARTSQRKYRNVPTVVDGMRFDSKAEARRWCELQMLQKAGQIRHLRRQVPYALTARLRADTLEAELAARVGRYIVDFEYFDVAADRWVYEDVKGIITPLAKWKLAHFKAQYGIDVQIVK